MPTSLLALLIILRSLIRSRIDLQLENLALRHQIGVLQRLSLCRVIQQILSSSLFNDRHAVTFSP
jgi:hypothetical protein